MPKEVVVLGCGIVGLTTAITLQEHNFIVKIITAKLPAETTSAVAAAIWLPYEVKPIDKVKYWSRTSYDKYSTLSDDISSGVNMVDMTIIIGAEEDAWWLDALPRENIRRAKTEELPADHDLGYILKVPMIETHLHLQFLLEKFETNGGRVEIRAVSNLEHLDRSIPVINCTGLAARQLTDDQELYPIQGQVVYLVADPKIKCTVSEIATGKNKDKLAYIIPRSDHIVLGGTAKVNEEGLQASMEEAQAIINRCKQLDSEIDSSKYVSTTVGLRPGRSEIRLEKENNIIHNYGHGGAGYTVAWGCAISVMDLI